jgi:hypothetical protein
VRNQHIGAKAWIPDPLMSQSVSMHQEDIDELRTLEPRLAVKILKMNRI